MIKAILFDLDDTLYEERQYFKSGFSVVAKELERRGAGKAEEMLRLLEYFHHYEAREGVFQKLAKRTAFPDDWISELVALFRSHRPSISLSEDAIKVLPQLKKRFKLGCVTDGNSQIQNNKLQALGVRDYFDVVVVTDELGKEYWKPHPMPFLKCCEILGIVPEEAVFVGDSPERDMVGASSAGMRAVLISKCSKNVELYHHSNQTIVSYCKVRNLCELEQLLVNKNTHFYTKLT